MALSILNNIPSLAAQNQLSISGASLQKTLFRLSSGSRINSGADDAAGLAIADGLHANVTALTQSARNATDGIGKLQVADGALAQVTNLLNRAVTLATEASNGTINSDQMSALDDEYTAIKAEITRIGSKTTFNGNVVFTGSGSVNDTNKYQSSNLVASPLSTSSTFADDTQTLTVTDTKTGNQKTYTTGDYADLGEMLTAIQGDEGTGAAQLDVNAAIVNGKLQITDASGDRSLYITTNIDELGASGMQAASMTTGTSDVFLSDGSTSDTISTTINALSPSSLALTHDLSVSNADDALTEITDAIATVASWRGGLGADINRLQSASNVINNQVQNLTSAEDGIRSADIAQEVANMTKFNILQQTGISALSQANQMQQGVLSLLR